MGVANNKCHGKVIWGGVGEGTENCISNVDRLPATTKKSVKVGGVEVDLKVGGRVYFDDDSGVITGKGWEPIMLGFYNSKEQ